MSIQGLGMVARDRYFRVEDLPDSSPVHLVFCKA